MTEEEEEDENKRIRPRERALGQKLDRIKKFGPTIEGLDSRLQSG